ncbi:MAG: beta-galactosidase trimerization domain-containing protein [Armatimonadota bacterium]
MHISVLIRRHLALVSLICALVLPAAAQFQLKPAVALEAEDFKVEKGWKVMQNGQGNYMVDIIGFQHISGERLLCADAQDTTSSAYRDITVPVDGNYRLWVRYEYPPFMDAPFQVTILQNNKKAAEKLMGAKDNPRLAFGDVNFKAQYDPSWGSEGLVEEVLDVPGLQAGTARIYLKTVPGKYQPGVSANRNLDLIYLSSDTEDSWRAHYAKSVNLYPILEAFRDSLGARYEVQFTNEGTKPAAFSVSYAYNRIPWGANEGQVAKDIAPGAGTDWVPLKKQDTAHFGIATFTSSTKEPFTVAIRPAGGEVEKTYTGSTVRVYLPSYPGKGEKPITPQEEVDAVLKLLAATPAPGKNPTLPLTYGGWIFYQTDDDYGRKYAQLYAAIGMRGFSASGTSSLDQVKNLLQFGWQPTKSLGIMGYRNPPTAANIASGKAAVEKNGLREYVQFYDYGDEIHFTEWTSYMLGEAKQMDAYKGMTDAQILSKMFAEWLAKNRPGFNPANYGAADLASLKPDSSAEASEKNPRLFVDSILFYEDAAIDFVARGHRAVKAALGDDILCGANYACHPFYYPTIPMYIKWFRQGAADYGRHSEYFWQVTQAGPMVNGYIAEHFRAGMRFNPQAINRQYTMPHSPGNTTASFLRTAYSHLAHGAKMLDYFGIGMNECFTENHIDHRDHQRFREIRDINYSIGLVEDQMLQSKVVPSKVALLLSDSTERWDHAGISKDKAYHEVFGAKFRTTRLSYHLDRLGLWKALTFQHASPDLIIEEDLNEKLLEGYRVLFVVGDSLPPAAAPAVEAWVKKGGVLVATAGAGRFDAYRAANTAWQQLFGLAERKTEEKERFFRVRQELPYLQPLAQVQVGGEKMPQIAINERITPAAGANVLATFTDGSPALINRALGNGQVFYCAALPGVAYLYTALQPPTVPDRGVVTHTVPTNFDKGTAAIVKMALDAAKYSAPVATTGGLIDTRLIKGTTAYVLPMANYNGEIGKPVTITLNVPEKIGKATSAYCGSLQLQTTGNTVTVTLPKLGYGDIVRFDIAK